MNLPSWWRAVAGIAAALNVWAQTPGTLDPAYLLPVGTDAPPMLLAPAPAGKLYVSGVFTNYAGTGRGALARLSRDGTVDPAFTLPPLLKISPPFILNGQVIVPGSTNVGTIKGILVLPDGRAVIAGGFTHLGDTQRPGLAVLNLDGSPAPFAPAIGKIDPDALLAGPDGTLYVSGIGFADTNRLPVLRLKLDGARDSGFVPPTVASLGYAGSFASVLRAGPGGTVYFAASVTLANFSSAFEIVRLQPNGNLDVTFAGGGQARVANPGLATFQSSPSGQLLFTGLDSFRGGTLPRKINRLTLDGAVDPTFQATVDPGIFGRLVAVQPDGKLLYVGSDRALGRLHLDGSVDPGFVNPTKVPVEQPGLVLSYFALAPDLSVFAGGARAGPGNVVTYGAFHLFGDPVTGPPERLNFDRGVDGLHLNWAAGLRLQRATQLAPADWQDLANPSPLIVPLNGPAEFYRVVPAL